MQTMTMLNGQHVRLHARSEDSLQLGSHMRTSQRFFVTHNAEVAMFYLNHIKVQMFGLPNTQKVQANARSPLCIRSPESASKKARVLPGACSLLLTFWLVGVAAC